MGIFFLFSTGTFLKLMFQHTPLQLWFCGDLRAAEVMPFLPTLWGLVLPKTTFSGRLDPGGLFSVLVGVFILPTQVNHWFLPLGKKVSRDMVERNVKKEHHSKGPSQDAGILAIAEQDPNSVADWGCILAHIPNARVIALTEVTKLFFQRVLLDVFSTTTAANHDKLLKSSRIPMKHNLHTMA